MADGLSAVIGSIAGAAITAGVSYYIYRRTRQPASGKAYEVLEGLGQILEEPEGEYHFTRCADDNYRVTSHIYTHADNRVIATAFHEDPSSYGEADLARSFKFGGNLFARITCEEVCGGESAQRARESLSNVLLGAALIVVPRGEAFTRIDGVFCRFSDDTHLCFVAYRDPENPAGNKGVIFRDGIARGFFDYYDMLAQKYTPHANGA